MMKILFRGTFAVALALTLTATGLWAAGAEEEGSTAAAEKEMVRDPATGEMILKPQYGGRIADVWVKDEPHMDTWWGSGTGRSSVNLVLEKMGVVDWSIDRDKWDLTSNYTPLSVVRGQLAESYEISPDGLTFTFHIRPGVHWQDKPPMNGRELVAEDIVFNFHRMTGLGDFAEAGPSEFNSNVSILPIESITAPDKYTVVFKLTKLNFTAFEFIYHESHEGAWIYPPEVIQEHGDAKDWRNLVGTGPYMLTDWAKGTSLTYTKNSNYWGYDEKFPENRLPYLDEVKMVVIPDSSTQLSALRTGKIARLTGLSFDQGQALQGTNPELLWTTVEAVPYSYAMNVRKPPFDDIRVRHAMQLALDNETINNTLFGGLGDTTPHGLAGPATIGFYTPFEEWPEDVKANYDYDPERAEAVLDAAGYPRGADGIRFSTKLMIDPAQTYWSDMDHAQLAATYWAEIGVGVELDLMEGAALGERKRAHTYEGMVHGNSAVNYNPLFWIRIMAYSDERHNAMGSRDPVYDAMVEAAENAGSAEEMMELVKEANNYFVEQQWNIWSPIVPGFVFWQPWMVGYNGEITMGGARSWLYLSRVWLDSDLKEAMGH